LAVCVIGIRERTTDWQQPLQRTHEDRTNWSKNMITKGLSPLTKSADITVCMQSLFGKLSSNPAESAKLFEWLKEAKDLLDYILIGTFDYDVAQSRIRNAIRYLESSELGAAKYEIRLLIGGMRSQFESTDKRISSTPSVR
jgi:hypothetical protein